MIKQRAPRLTEQQKRNIIEYYNEGYTYKRICELCNCSVGTVQKHLGFDYKNKTKQKSTYNIQKIDSSDIIQKNNTQIISENIDDNDDLLTECWKIVKGSNERVKKDIIMKNI